MEGVLTACNNMQAAHNIGSICYLKAGLKLLEIIYIPVCTYTSP
jgi:hypothetical protein